MLNTMIVVFGATGYIGSILTRRLSQIRTPHICPNRQNLQIENLSSLKSWKLKYLGHLSESDLTVVYLVSRRKESKWDQRQIAEPSTHLHNISRIFVHSRVIFTSSVDVYGHPINLPITESTPNKGVTPYALSKIYAESALEDYFPSELTLTLRLPGVYGVSPKSKSVYDSFFRKLKAGIPIEIRNKRVLQLKRDWIYANDLINFIVAVTQDFTPGVFNFVTGNSRSIYDWIQVISMATDLKPIFNILNGSTDEQTFDLVFDASRLYNAFPELTFSAPELSNFASNS